MIFKYFLKSRVFSKHITIKNVHYVKAKQLYKTEVYLNAVRIVITLILMVYAYYLVVNKIMDFGTLNNGGFILLQIIIGYILILPFYFIFLQKPLWDFLLIED